SGAFDQVAAGLAAGGGGGGEGERAGGGARQRVAVDKPGHGAAEHGVGVTVEPARGVGDVSQRGGVDGERTVDVLEAVRGRGGPGGDDGVGADVDRRAAQDGEG